MLSSDPVIPVPVVTQPYTTITAKTMDLFDDNQVIKANHYTREVGKEHGAGYTSRITFQFI